MMRMKLVVTVAVVMAMAIVAAAPALAQRNHHHHDNGIQQSNEQEIESGDASQTINVTGGGDNSNACQGVQGINNTGNAVQNTGVLQYASEDSEVEVDDSGNFAISPTQTTTCNQQVNQAASASGR
jgi:hypothetical protein